MAYAPYGNETVYNGVGDKIKPAILGSFRIEKYGTSFEYTERLDTDYLPEYPHLIYVSYKQDLPAGMAPYRYGLVKKTVVYVVVDEAPDGSPIVEKWKTLPWKNLKYKKPLPNGTWE